MCYQIASSASNQRTKFVGFTLQTYGFAPLTRWRRELQKGVLGDRPPYRFYCHCTIFMKEKPSNSEVLNPETMIGVTKKGVRKFIKYRVIDN